MTARVHLCRRWDTGSAAPAPVLSGVELREIQPEDAPALGRVLWSAYRGSEDEEYQTVADAEAEARQTLNGKWGPFVSHASLVALIGADIVAARAGRPRQRAR